MQKIIFACFVLFAILLYPVKSIAQSFPAESPESPFPVSRSGNTWTITGKRLTVTLREPDLLLTVQCGGALWEFMAASTNDLTVKSETETSKVRLAAAGKKVFTPVSDESGAGVTVALSGFKSYSGNELYLEMRLKIFIESPGEDLVCEVKAFEGSETLRECLWPKGVHPGTFDFSVVPHMQGMLLPNIWPEKVSLYSTATYSRGLYMPWWGHLKGKCAMLTILETPNDAGCNFSHPAGGPTAIEPRWVHSQGSFRYPRILRMCFLENGDYVDLAKRYRKHAIERGYFVSLRNKILFTPSLEKVIGSALTNFQILVHIQPESQNYDLARPENNHRLDSFDTRASQLDSLAGRWGGRLYVHVDGWGVRGYDNLHPDYLPPCPEAGGWDGLRRLLETCRRLGYVVALHDQYRDYYHDAPSYDPNRTVIYENGVRPFSDTWNGGAHSFLCPRYTPQYVERNHQMLKENGIAVQGSYLDVFAVIPPDECYHPSHQVSRTQCLEYWGQCFNIIKRKEGIVSSEEPVDWAIPYLDLVACAPYVPSGEGNTIPRGIPIPLFNLVYHDALIIPWPLSRNGSGIPQGEPGYLHGLLNGGIPEIPLTASETGLARAREMCTLHERVGLREMIRHEFLNGNFRMQRTTFSDGTAVTVDFEEEKYEISWGSGISVKEPLQPAVLSLGNYPNPFNAATTIRFTLPSSGPVNLEVYSVSGQKVRKLVDKHLPAGEHAVSWDGHDDRGRPVASGIYLSILRAGAGTVSGRMLLMK
ncbi:MAG: DUF5696 domain-containing protein [Candidatus Latescibacterota bacterium]